MIKLTKDIFPYNVGDKFKHIYGDIYTIIKIDDWGFIHTRGKTFNKIQEVHYTHFLHAIEKEYLYKVTV